MKPPDVHKLVTLLEDKDTRSKILKTLAPAGDEQANKILESLLPDTLYDVIDAQRDWIVSTDCPTDRRDSYLVQAFGESWDSLVKPGITEIAAARLADVRTGIVLEEQSPYRKNALQPCKDLASFSQSLRPATGELLDKLDWTNVVLAGGAVVGILTGQARWSTYAASDVDLFLVGLQKDELLPKVRSMIHQIQAAVASVVGSGEPAINFSPASLQAEYTELSSREPNMRQNDWANQFPDRLLVLKGFNAITLVPPLVYEPRRLIQIVLNSAPTVYDALAWYDLDCCTVGLTGDAVIALPRAVRALSLGAWTGGINFFDPKLSRKGDTTAAIASGRALKYAQRGFALTLPGPAKRALDNFGFKYVDTIKRLRTSERAQQQTRREPDVTRRRTEDLAGLPGLLRREAIQHRRSNSKPAPHSDDVTLDYGYRKASWIKIVSQADLQAKANGEILRDFYDYAAKDVALSIKHLFLTVDKAIAEHAEYIPEAPTKRHEGLKRPLGRKRPYADYVVPYVASFDRDFVLGFKSYPADPYEQEWTKIRNLQYIIKLPKSLLPVLEKSSEAMSALFSETILSSSGTLDGMAGGYWVEIPQAVHDSMEQLYTDLLETMQPSQLASVSFPGAYRKTPPTGGWPGFGKPAPADPGPALFLTPFSAADGREIQPASSAYVYRVPNLAGLWQFKGVHPDVDLALNIVWQANVRAAMTLPRDPDINGLKKCPWWLEPSPYEMPLAQVRSELTLGNAGLLEDLRDLPKSDRNEIIAWIEQLSSEEVYKRLDKELDQIEANAKAESKAPLAQAVGCWDAEGSAGSDSGSRAWR